MDHLGDDELLALTPRRPEAFAVFYRRHERALLGYLVRRTGDPELAESHCTMAYLHAVRDHDWTAAEQGFKRALELSPSNAATCDLYGRMCAALERYDESIALLQCT